jgi:hypothetical protein
LLSDVALSGWPPPQFAVFDARSMVFGGDLNWPIEVTLIAICLFVEQIRANFLRFLQPHNIHHKA